jgi:hypothetical protein
MFHDNVINNKNLWLKYLESNKITELSHLVILKNKTTLFNDPDFIYAIANYNNVHELFSTETAKMCLKDNVYHLGTKLLDKVGAQLIRHLDDSSKFALADKIKEIKAIDKGLIAYEDGEIGLEEFINQNDIKPFVIDSLTDTISYKINSYYSKNCEGKKPEEIEILNLEMKKSPAETLQNLNSILKTSVDEIKNNSIQL